MLVFYVQSQDPKTHIEACSIIDFLNIKILDSKIGDQNDPFYGEFMVEGSPDAFEIFSGIPGISLIMDKNSISKKWYIEGLKKF